MSTPRRRRRGFGAIRKLPSGRWQASYIGPDGRRHAAPRTFDTRGDAEGWLAAAQTDISREEWQRPAPKRPKVPAFGEYAQAWLVGHHKLTPRTRDEYRKLLDGHLLPQWGDERLDDITAAEVRAWHAQLGQVTGPTRQAHAYGLLRTILNTAVADEVIPANPCRLRGAGQVKRKSQTKPATLPELGVLVDGIPARYQAAVLLAAWCGLRFGELAELRRRDIELRGETDGVVKVSRAVVWVSGQPIIGRPKSDAGVRSVTLPEHVVLALREHLAHHTAPGRDALLFPSPSGGNLRSDGALHRAFYAAREQAGRPDLRFHDLRHTGASLAAATGATLADLMKRLGHSTAAAALRYQHAMEDRDRAIAEALSGFHAAQAVSLRPMAPQA